MSYQPIIRRLAAVAADESGLTRDEFFAVGRGVPWRISRLRFAVMKVAKEQGRSFPLITRHLGMRSHTSTIYGCERADKLEKSDPAFALLLTRLREEAGQ